ncbi:MAG: hypothetical protein AAGD01_18220 [Acidobacteriota bacterium]
MGKDWGQDGVKYRGSDQGVEEDSITSRSSSEGTESPRGQIADEVEEDAEMGVAGQTPRALYRRRRQRADEEAKRLRAIASRYSWARLVSSAGIFIPLGIFVVRGSELEAHWLAAAAVALAIFLLLSSRHRRTQVEEERSRLRAQVNAEGLARLERRWEELPPAAGQSFSEGEEDPLPPRARDLDLFGEVSLARLLSTAATPFGRRALEARLLESASCEEIAARQAGVEELSPRLDLRQDLEVLGRELMGSPSLEIFLRQAESEPLLEDRPVLRLWAWFGPLLVWGLAAGWWWAGLTWHPFALAFLVNLAFAYAPGAAAQERFMLLAESSDRFQRYGDLFERLEEEAAERPFEAPQLREAQDAWSSTGIPVSREMRSLARLADRANARLNPYVVVAQGLALWDLHVLRGLDAWQRRAGRQARGWLAALGALEASCALAALRFEHPGWCLPQVDPRAASLEARGLAHPLLPPDGAVANDVEIGPQGRVLLVTGSNMSGKSTLLRAVGLAVVLGNAGGPVSARDLKMPPLRIATSILVEDSLAGGVSFFLAELYRLKSVVDSAREASPAQNSEAQTPEAQGSPRVLYLLDEVLRGTNSAERRTAVETVVHHLLECGAIGAVTTHDLQLAESPLLQEAMVPVHFREEIHSPDAQEGGDGKEEVMTFDYQLRPGLATTTNALALLRLVGLGDGAPVRKA